MRGMMIDTRTCRYTLAVLVLAGSTLLAAQQPSLNDAAAKLQAGDFAGAAKVLELVTKNEPANARAWRMFGIALQQNKELDRALAAYQKFLTLQPVAPAVTYNIGTVYALKGDADRAFEWLGKAKTTGKMDMTQLQVDPDVAALKNDPRFAALLPKAADFANPFVEDTRIIREWDGEAIGDQFGWIARDIGDLDRDGVHDIVTSAPTKVIGGGAPAGRVYVYSTKSGALLWKVDGKPGDTLGIGIEAAGDANKDGVPDVIASAPGGGYACIYSGKDGSVLQTFKAEAVSDAFGRHVSGAGDVNGDGAADVIVGAPANTANGKAAGRAYVYSGGDGRLLLTLTGERAGDQFGAAVAGYSDGKHRFLIVGAPGAGPRHTGRTYVYDSLSQKPAFTADSDATGAALGAMFLSVPGDLNSDGVPDIYATDFPNAAKGPSTGRAYVYSGKDGSTLRTLTGETPGEGFGIGAATMGDADGDGVPDLVIGSWQYSATAASAGRAYLYSGKDGTLLRTYTCRIPGDTFGFDAVGIGDVDGDGTIDLLDHVGLERHLRQPLGPHVRDLERNQEGLTAQGSGLRGDRLLQAQRVGRLDARGGAGRRRRERVSACGIETRAPGRNQRARGSLRRPSAKPEVARSQPLEGRAIRSDDVRVQHVGGRDQPRVVLAHPPRRAPLQQGAPARLGEVDALDGKPLQRGEGSRLVHGALENLLDGHDRDRQRAATKRPEERRRRTGPSAGCFALERDEERGVEQDRPAHGLIWASPSPLPFA